MHLMKILKKILTEPSLQKKYSEESKVKAKDFDAIKIEKREVLVVN